MPAISLEDFQAEVDPEGFYSEKELLSLFAERFAATDPTVTRQAQRNERLIRRLREAIINVASSKNFTLRADVGRDDELGQAATAFNLETVVG